MRVSFYKPQRNQASETPDLLEMMTRPIPATCRWPYKASWLMTAEATEKEKCHAFIITVTIESEKLIKTSSRFEKGVPNKNKTVGAQPPAVPSYFIAFNNQS